MNLSKNFTLAEATRSQIAQEHGIDNTPSSAILAVMQHTAERMEFVRAALGNNPVKVSSWYRCEAVCRILGAKPLISQHTLGEAVDFTCPAYGTPLQIAKRLVAVVEIINYDQLIYEGGWIHISFKSDPAIKNRRQVLTLLANGHYTTGITDKKGLLL